LELGGAQTYLHDLLKHHTASGKVVPEIIVLNRSGEIGKAIGKSGFQIKEFGMRNGHDLKPIWELRRYLRKINVDIIHSHAHNFAFNLLLKEIPIPKIYTEHGGGLLAEDKRNILFYKLFWGNYKKFIAISNEMKVVMQNVNKKIADRVSVVYNGVDLETIDKEISIEANYLSSGLSSAKFIVGTIARLVPAKGIDTFLKTAAIITRKRDDIKFLILGDGPLRFELEAEAAKLNIEQQISFLGFRTDARKILKSFDVLLSTSNYEAFGLVLTEAMAKRVPVVALHSKGAVPEIIKNSVEGFVVDSKDPYLLADKVLTLLDDKKLRDHFTRNARKKVERYFTIEKNALKILEIYRECTGKANM
jgi:glycosyltransferase involved in cell wall biosynthesis